MTHLQRIEIAAKQGFSVQVAWNLGYHVILWNGSNGAKSNGASEHLGPAIRAAFETAVAFGWIKP